MFVTPAENNTTVLKTDLNSVKYCVAYVASSLGSILFFLPVSSSPGSPKKDELIISLFLSLTLYRSPIMYHLLFFSCSKTCENSFSFAEISPILVTRLPKGLDRECRYMADIFSARSPAGFCTLLQTGCIKFQEFPLPKTYMSIFL